MSELSQQKQMSNSQNYVHLMLGSKGGIGKTFILCYLTDYLWSEGRVLSVIDTDTANVWLQKAKHFKAITFNMYDSENLISFEKIPEIFDMFTDRDLVIDTGANSYSAWREYLVNGGAEEIKYRGLKLMLHVPVVPGSAFTECVNCIEELVDLNFDCKYSIWLNNSAIAKSQSIKVEDFLAHPVFKKLEKYEPRITELPVCDPLHRRLVNEIHDNYYSLAEIANATPKELSKYTVFGRKLSIGDIVQAKYYQDKISSKLGSFINTRSFDVCCLK